MESDIHNQILAIKKNLRLSMNGIVSSHQRKQGLDYKINFGVEIPRIKSIASMHEKNSILAKTLWNENIRECKILAILLMPDEEFSTQMADEWISQTKFTEIADQLVMNLLCKEKNATENSLRRISINDALFPYCGFLTLSHLFKQGIRFLPQQEELFLKRIIEILGNAKNENRATQICANNTLQRYLNCDEERNITLLREAMKKHPIDTESILATITKQ